MMRFAIQLILWWALAASSQAGQLLAVKAEPEFDTLRLSLELSAPTQFRYSLLDKPDRLVVELIATEASSSFNPATLKAPPVSSLRHSLNGKNLKLVFELDSSALVKAYKLRSGQQQPDRVVLELSGFKAVGVRKESSTDK
ncbi:MAG TPA: AMIN domain-containing protein, partial [Marinagarivorans sp.]|nr:AMIN domain-containing protein [Marinagarivorans sp.]